MQNQEMFICDQTFEFSLQLFKCFIENLGLLSAWFPNRHNAVLGFLCQKRC